jgi:hypothetical protein
MFQYVILANIVVLIVLGIRQQYLAYKLRTYMKEKYPEKLEEFFRHTFTSPFRMDRWLREKDDATGDIHLICLKVKVKNATNMAVLVFLLSPLLWILYFIIVVFPNR